MKFERSELGALFSKLRTAVPEVRAVGTDDAGILLSGSNAYATNLELSVRAGLSKPVEQDVVVPPRGVDFISGTVAPEISIEADKGILTVKSGTARARLNTTPAENYPEFSGPGNDAKRCIVGANDLSWAISKVLYAVSKDEKHPAHRGLCFSRKGEDVLEICALDGYRMAIARINCTADGDFRFTLPAATAKAVDTLSMDGSVEIVRDRKKAVFSDSNFEVKSRLIAEPFLDYGKVVAQRNEGTRIALDRKELLGVLGRVKLARSADAKEKSVLVMDLEPGGTGRASIKNDLFGEKRVAVEVFPTQDRLVDVCDCYHLWVFEKGFQLPFGIHPRDKKTVTVNRGSTRVRAIDGAGREHSIKELLEENGAADVPKQAYAQAMAGYMMKNLLGG